MATDPFDDLLELENDFYKEGYDAGVADSLHAGLIEGKVFGIEKGYEKALELGQLHGKACIWYQRLAQGTIESPEPDNPQVSSPSPPIVVESGLASKLTNLSKLPDNPRLRKHIESLLALTDLDSISRNNSDEAVSEFEDRLSKAKAKAKVIAKITGEASESVRTSNFGIEESAGLSARH